MNVFAAFPDLVRLHRIEPRHLAHVGAHAGQEVPYYLEAGFERITLIEPIPEYAAGLRGRWPGVEVVQAACAEYPGHQVLHVMRRSNMSTLVPLDRRDRSLCQRQITVDVVRLRDVVSNANVIVVDAQGMELPVLRGTDLSKVDLAIVETCTVDDLTMASQYEDVVTYMAEHGFVSAAQWVRDYGFVHRWARGVSPAKRGEIRDVSFVRVSS